MAGAAGITTRVQTSAVLVGAQVGVLGDRVMPGLLPVAKSVLKGRGSQFSFTVSSKGVQGRSFVGGCGSVTQMRKSVDNGEPPRGHTRM